MRILFGTWGSAGDLFPLIPVAQAAQSEGHQILFAVPRMQGLYLRALGINTAAIGSGLESKVAGDPSAVSKRFGGWSSWRTLWQRYVAGDLADSIAGAERAIEMFEPHLIVTTTFATAMRVAADRCGVPRVNVSIYPQHARLSGHRHFARSYIEALAHEVSSEAGSSLTDSLTWGIDESMVWLHDPLLLSELDIGLGAVAGFTSWDAAVGSSGALDVAQQFLAAGAPPVLITLGSFIGFHRADLLTEVVEAVVGAGDRCLVLGGPRNFGDSWSRADVCAIPFTPLAPLIGGCRYAVHHGGIGTTFAVFRAGLSAIVLPQAYDQFFNAWLIEQRGFGFDASQRSIRDAVDLLDANAQAVGDGVAALASRLVPPEQAARNAVAMLTSV